MASERNNAGFSIERRTASTNTYRDIGFIEGQGTGNAAQYSFVDEVLPAGLYRYELVANGLASGNYIYRLVTSSGMMTRNMILLK